jgi:hypothetical protein
MAPGLAREKGANPPLMASVLKEENQGLSAADPCNFRNFTMFDTPTAAAEPAAAEPAAVEPAAVEPAAVEPAAVEPSAIPAPNNIGESAPPDNTDTNKRTRVQLAHILGVDVSQARCATHLKQNLGDDSIEEEIKSLRTTLKKAKADGLDLGDLKVQIGEKSKSLVRISGETPIAAAVIWDGAVKEILRHGMDLAIASDRKIVDTTHLHDGSPSSLIYYPLFSKCEIWAKYNQDHEEELKKERAATNRVAKEVREAKKAADEKTAKGVKNPKTPTTEDDVEDDNDPPTKTTFYTYVENALKTVKKDDPYKSMRVSNRVREYLSELVAQGIARQATLARIIVQRVMGVRTMNADHVKAVVHVLMADEGRTSDQINLVTGQIDKKLDLYHEHLAEEKIKKAASLDETKKSEVERKKHEFDLNRKKKQAELAKRRAIEAAQKAKDLNAETALLEPIVAAEKAEAAAAAGAL